MSKESDPDDIRNDALEALELSRLKIHSWKFLKALKTAPQQDRDAAPKLMFDVSMAHQALLQAKLSKITADLREQEPDLKKATKSLEGAVTDLNNTRQVIEAVGKVVEVVAKVVAIV